MSGNNYLSQTVDQVIWNGHSVWISRCEQFFYSTFLYPQPCYYLLANEVVIGKNNGFDLVLGNIKICLN